MRADRWFGTRAAFPSSSFRITFVRCLLRCHFFLLFFFTLVAASSSAYPSLLLALERLVFAGFAQHHFFRCMRALLLYALCGLVLFYSFTVAVHCVSWTMPCVLVLRIIYGAVVLATVPAAGTDFIRFSSLYLRTLCCTILPARAVLQRTPRHVLRCCYGACCHAVLRCLLNLHVHAMDISLLMRVTVMGLHGFYVFLSFTFSIILFAAYTWSVLRLNAFCWFSFVCAFYAAARRAGFCVRRRLSSACCTLGAANVPLRRLPACRPLPALRDGTAPARCLLPHRRAAALPTLRARHALRTAGSQFLLFLPAAPSAFGRLVSDTYPVLSVGISFPALLSRAPCPCRFLPSLRTLPFFPVTPLPCPATFMQHLLGVWRSYSRFRWGWDGLERLSVLRPDHDG